jgi:hypothetical protein
MPFKFAIKDPKAVMISSVAGLAAWKASNFATDVTHIGMALTAATAGLAAPSNPSSKPNVAPESHIQTPYVSNLEPKENN